jgi:methionyl-tRNA formyltransferase
MKNVFFIDGKVGTELLTWLLTNHLEDVALVVYVEGNLEVEEICSKYHVACASSAMLESDVKRRFDFGFTLWWPNILSSEILKMVENDFFNIHPSLLPAQRGKGTSFWNLVENSSFGVTIHKIGMQIDKGEIVAQVEIPKSWEDTGGSLALKAQGALANLFKRWYPHVGKKLLLEKDCQNAETFHQLKDISDRSSLNLDETVRVRDLLNLLRAKVHADYPGCTFTEEGKTYEIQIQIREVSHGQA